jgi:NADH dehydrogenase [ubiquinone] 1 alpha subcomplex assembly factor 3
MALGRLETDFNFTIDLLILGLGPSMAPLSPATRKFINGLGIRVDIQDTRNASAQFNLLATERGLSSVAAALIPLGWREGVGVK